jgi:hypothetical protein
MQLGIAAISSNASAIWIILPDSFQSDAYYHIVPETSYTFSGFHPAHEPVAIIEHARVEQAPILSDNRPDILSGPICISALWLPNVERRIRNSTNPPDTQYVNDGRFLSASIAQKAMEFFESTSDVLPSEPYIYTSMHGDLVAEFRTARGSMTNIIGQTSVITFAVIDGALTKSLDLRDDNLGAARYKLQTLTKELLMGPDGVGSGK